MSEEQSFEPISFFDQKKALGFFTDCNKDVKLQQSKQFQKYQYHHHQLLQAQARSTTPKLKTMNIRERDVAGDLHHSKKPSILHLHQCKPPAATTFITDSLHHTRFIVVNRGYRRNQATVNTIQQTVNTGTFARYVASYLNTYDMVINTPNGNIPVDRMAVHEVLGFPMGHKKIQCKRVSNYDTPLALQWKKHSHNSLKPIDIANRIKETTTLDRMFQVDFLLLYCDRVSVMLEPPVERNRPVIAEWKGKDLKRREEADIGNGGYGGSQENVEEPHVRKSTRERRHTNRYSPGEMHKKKDREKEGRQVKKAGTTFGVTKPWQVDKSFIEKLEGSFFHSIAKMTPYRQCHIFQTFIRDCYDNNTRTFTFGPDRDIHLYFGLEDIYALLGIPVDENPVICNDISTQELCMKMLGSYELSGKKKMQVSKAWLRQSFEAASADLTEKTLIYHVRTYLLYLIGTRILPNSDNSLYFPAYWLQFLEDVNACGLNNVAWGAAGHCLLTSTITSNSSTGFLGPSWLYEDIVWTPYCDYLSYRAQRIFFSRSVLINFDKIQYHEPEKVPKQLSITDLEEVGEHEALKTRMSRLTTQRNYYKRYEKYIKMCKKERHQENICIKDTCPFKLLLCPDQESSEEDEIDATHETTHDETT
ncbi:hypothetical protein E3N88_20477 [Mikania micrantha]|uniref:Aminotransferase-like plant mobile domain-containing protein n=1 Tax=Mikania micrantha TaxID=192012 RepID=A0A5N6NHJ4_9ASTR|nr:hypothetical protein E3N88_20477 [Mikania micrantha]